MARIQHGSLEQEERQRILNLSETQSQISQLSTRANSTRPDVRQLPLPNPNRNSMEVEAQEFISFSEEVEESKRNQQELEKKYELQRQMRNIKVPTMESEVKSQLRQLGHPVTYFGEQASDRRERLKKLVTEFLMANGRLPQFDLSQQFSQQAQRDIENLYFLYEGKDILREWRLNIAKYSLHEAALRVEKSRLRRLLVDALEEDREVEKECRQASRFEIQMSQFADASCVSRGTIAPNQKLFGSAGGTGECKIWNIEDTNLRSSLLGHLTKVHSISFHPQSTLTLPSNLQCNIATGSSDLTIRLWSLDLSEEQEEVSGYGILQKSIQLKGHEDRINKVMFHQLGKLLLSVSHDRTWRLWDIEHQEEILCQTGHSKAAYAGALHPDGSLFFSGDLGGSGMIWDLRTGRGVLPILGHVKGILSADFSPNGYQLATGGDDNNLRLWDLRRRGPLQKIPAHTKLLSDVKFQPVYGRYLTTCSYDGTVKIWNAREWSLIKTYKENDSKLTSLSITSDQEYMITTAIDRKYLVWKRTSQESIV